MNRILAFPWVADTAAVVFPVLLDTALKSVVLLSVALLLIAALRPFSSASRRHWVLLLGITSLLVLPSLSIGLPRWEVLPVQFDRSTAPADIALSSEHDAPLVTPPSVNPESQIQFALPSQPAPPIDVMRSDAPAELYSPAPSSPIPTTASDPIAPNPSVAAWPAVGLLIWGAGVLLFLARLLAARLYLARFTARSSTIRDGRVIQHLRKACDELGIRPPVRVLLNDSRAMPMMWGIWRASILLPAESQSWSDARLRTVLLHELAHVKRRDCLSQLIVQLTCALYWFNPLAWIAAWRIRVEREQACDDLVLAVGTKASDYAEHLLAVATGYERQRPAQAAALAMAHRFRLEGRLLAVLNGTLNRARLSRRMAFASLLVSIALLVPVAMMQGREDRTPESGTSQAPTGAETPDTGKVPKPTPTEATVVGYVRDTRQQPVAGVKVVALARENQPIAISAADGRFQMKVPLKELAGLTLIARHDKGARQAFHRLSYEQTAPPTEPIPLVLRPAREIAITVVDAKNQPVANSFAAAVSGYQKMAESKTDPAGKAALLVPADAPLQYVVANKDGVGLDYFAYRGKDDPVSDPYRLAPDHREPLRLVLNGTRTVKVRVIDANEQPMVGLTVAPWYFGKPNKGVELNSGLREFDRVTDETGVATFTNIPADNTGKVTFWVRAEGYFAPQRWVWDPKSAVDELTATMLPMVKVRGSVALPDGRPAADIEIKVVGGGHQIDGFHGSTRTSNEGKFEILVYPDQYYMLAPISDRWAAVTQHRVVRQADSDGVDFVLQPATRVFGRITMGDENAPWAGGYLQLYQKDDSYYKLPTSEQLPNPTGSNRAVAPRLIRNTRTDNEGRFAFFAGPGSYYITGPQNIKAPYFDITDQKELEVNVRLPGPERGLITGRVVLKDDSSRGVSEAKVSGYPTESSGGYINAVTDKEGRFAQQRQLSGMIIRAVSSDGKQAGIVKISAEDKTVEIPIGPLASARGRLVDEETGEPLPDKRLDYGVQTIYTDRPALSSTHFGDSVRTDERGEFTVTGLVVGWEYTISVVMEVDNEGHARSWHGVGKVTVKDTNVVEIGDLKLKPPYRPPTVKERVAKDFGQKESLDDRLRAKSRDARLGHHRVLVVAADPDSALCQQFYAQHYDDEQRDVRDRMADYLVLPLDTTANDTAREAKQFASRLGFAWPDAGDVTLAVLSSEGKLVGELSTKQIVVDGKIDRERLASFLRRHAPSMPDAEKLLADALSRAKREDKRVLVQHSGAYCGPCVLLSRFLDEHRDLIAKDYIYLSVDDRFTNGEAVIKRLGKQEGGIPWTVILNSEGKPLISSDGPNGNVGFPSSSQGRAHFEKMLRTSARHLRNEEIQVLLAALAKQAS